MARLAFHVVEIEEPKAGTGVEIELRNQRQTGREP